MAENTEENFQDESQNRGLIKFIADIQIRYLVAFLLILGALFLIDKTYMSGQYQQALNLFAEAQKMINKPVPSPTPIPTITQKPTATPTTFITPTPTALPTQTPAPTILPTNTPAATQTPAPTPTLTAQPSPTPTSTP